MSTNIANRVPYLITSREFATDGQELAVQLNKTYIDIANNVNTKTIGIFAAGRPSINGEAWFLSGGNQKQQALRQVYPFTAAGSIPHGINLSSISGFVRIYGTVQDSSGNWYPLPLVDGVDVTAQISIQVTSANIVIAAGAAAITIESGFCVLEWLSSS